jgi:hypothetical protein
MYFKQKNMLDETNNSRVSMYFAIAAALYSGKIEVRIMSHNQELNSAYDLKLPFDPPLPVQTNTFIAWMKKKGYFCISKPQRISNSGVYIEFMAEV